MCRGEEPGKEINIVDMKNMTVDIRQRARYIGPVACSKGNRGAAVGGNLAICGIKKEARSSNQNLKSVIS